MSKCLHFLLMFFIVRSGTEATGFISRLVEPVCPHKAAENRTSRAVTLSQAFHFIYSLFFPRLIFFDRKWSYCWGEQWWGRSLLSCFSQKDVMIFFLPQEEVRWNNQFILWMLKKAHNITEWHFIVIFVCIKNGWMKHILTVWYVNLQSGKIVQA